MASWSDYANYGVDPWSTITRNEREWYDPILREMYMRGAVYSPHVSMKVDMNGPKARTIYFDDVIAPRPNIAPLANRAMDATRLYSDSYRREVTTARYGNGMSIHKESNMFVYWQARGGGTGSGLMPLINQSLGHVVTDHLDMLARNAFFTHPYPKRGLNSASSLSGISNTDVLTTEVLDEIWLGMRDRLRPFSPLPQSYITGEELICLTTAGMVHDLKREVGTGAGGLNFVDVNKYSESGRAALIRGELGVYRGVRFVDNPLAKLYNSGIISHQTTIKAAVKPGDGAANPDTTRVEGVRRVGQPGATHWIRVQDGSGFEAGDIVTVHLLRHDANSLAAASGNGTLNGPLFSDAMLQNIEVHGVDTAGGAGDHHLILKEPYMMTNDTGAGLETDLGGTVFGYVTKAAHIHTALFLAPGMENNPLIAGVTQPPTFYTPPAIDDFLSVYRITYDFWLKYQLWDARAYELLFLRGSNRGWGSVFR